MTRIPTKRRLLLAAAVLFLAALAVGIVARLSLAGMVIDAALRKAGATDVRFQVAHATPWRLVVEDLAFLVRLRPFAAREVTLERAHWWTPSLGKVRVAQARVELRGEELAGKPPAAAAGPAGGMPRLPVEEISVDGLLVLRAAEAPDQSLTVRIDAKPAGGSAWAGHTEVTAPGLAVKGEATYDLANGDLAFNLPEIAVDLKTWQDFLTRLATVPTGDIVAEGKLRGSAEGRLSAGKFFASGKVSLREGRGESKAQAITAEGIEADLEFTDLVNVVTKPGTMRIAELRAGQLVLREMRWEFSLAGTDRIDVAHVSLQTLGGRVSAEPFRFFPSKGELDAVLLVDNVSVEEVMALTKDLPAKARGRVNGRVPVAIAGNGLRFGSGWLELKPGVKAEIQFNSQGLLTGGATPGTPAFAVLQRVETGLLKLQVNELRLEIRPPNAPEGRTAQLHLAGEPLDKSVKAPVTLDLNVNGPLEKLLNMGLDSRLSFGTGK